ncbi:hypothetical protein JKP88DRAFT_262864 [Tribonema minus]|uniref:Nudix hydrolase domain-containing protein n=1 Tax=Tribonema minus TaxID=303371 RepID=A0A836CI15_9STRA|nr:hypothetical protein JKP88DRAFT_262864 [Tribonema minus]
MGARQVVHAVLVAACFSVASSFVPTTGHGCYAPQLVKEHELQKIQYSCRLALAQRQRHGSYGGLRMTAAAPSEYYKAAGILPLAWLPEDRGGHLAVLLAMEVRKGKRLLGHMGGKREAADKGPAFTAWREAWEESGKVLSSNARATFLAAAESGDTRVLWVPECEQAIFLYQVPVTWGDGLARSFNSATAAAAGGGSDGIAGNGADDAAEDEAALVAAERQWKDVWREQRDAAQGTTASAHSTPFAAAAAEAHSILTHSAADLRKTTLTELLWVPVQNLLSKEGLPGELELAPVLRFLLANEDFAEELRLACRSPRAP